MFWALVLEAGKRYSQTVEQSFHISMAALEVPSDQDSSKGKQNSVSVMIANQKSEFLICSLNNRNTTQQPLDLNFNEGEEVTFFVNGQGTVHLTGYQIEDEDLDMLDEMDSEDEEAPELVPTKKRKTDDGESGSQQKKTKWLTPGGGDFDADDSDEDSEDNEDFDPSDLLDLEAAEDDEEDDDDDGDDDFEDDEDMSDEDFDEEDDEMEELPVQKTPKSGRKAQKDGQMNGKKVEQTKKSEQTPKQEKNKSKKQTETPKPEQKADTVSTPGPGGDGEQSAQKKKKKKKKKNKNVENAGSQDQSEAKTPQAQQKPQTPGNTKQGKQQTQTPGKTPQGKQQSQTPGKTPQTPKRQVLAGGIIAEDIKSGDGPVVKKGKMAHVYYVGKLQKDGRQFDSCTTGKPFRFKLGLGEVIQGWDKGVEGMKVGGKRRLTVPPQQGYGNQRSGPIPPNSTLVFEVELKNVS